MQNPLLNLFFPRLCSGCNSILFRNEQVICTRCLADLPETNYHLQPGNRIEQIFWGRVKIERAFSFLFFRKQGITRNLLHQLKYKDVKEIGFVLGKLYGLRLEQTVKDAGIDGVMAVPLHRSKLMKRGYNQAQLFSEGLAASLRIEECSNNIIRIRATETQTRKTRAERQDNVNMIFSINNPGRFVNRHLLLVDDVITTGATLESCADSLQNIPGCRVSLGSIAFTG